MLPLYRAHAIIHERASNLEIIISAEKNWFHITFHAVWLIFWCYGEFSTLEMVLNNNSPKKPFVLFWLIPWTLGGIALILSLIWLLFGREVITVGQGFLRVRKKWTLFARTRTYNVNQIEHMRMQSDAPKDEWDYRPPSYFQGLSGGTIRFEYNDLIVRIGAGLREPEAANVLESMYKHQVIPPNSFDPELAVYFST